MAKKPSESIAAHSAKATPGSKAPAEEKPNAAATHAPQPEQADIQPGHPADSASAESATPDTPPAAVIDPASAKSAEAAEPTHECQVVSPLRHNGKRYKLEELVMLFEHEFERLEKSGAVVLNKILGEDQ